MGFIAIGRELGVSNGTVLQLAPGKSRHWIKAHHEWQERPERAETLELDAMRHFSRYQKGPYGFGLPGTALGCVYLTLLRRGAKPAREGGRVKNAKP